MSDSNSPRLLLAAAFSDADPAVADYLLTGAGVGFPARMSEASRTALSAIDPKVRAPFYLAMDRLDRGDDLVLMRLGRLLAVLPNRGYTAPEGVPHSVWALLKDATLAVFGERWSAPEFTSLTIDRIEALLRMEGVSPAGVEVMIVDMLIGASRSSLSYPPRGMQTIPGTAAWATEHAAAVAARAQYFGPTAYLELSRLASSHPPLAVAIAPTLVSRAANGSADERAVALAAIGAIPAEVQIATFEGALKQADATERRNLVAAIERIPDIPAAIALLERERARSSTAVASDLAGTIRRMTIYERLAPDGAMPTLIPLEEHQLGEPAIESMRVAVSALRDRLSDRLPTMRAERDVFLNANPGQHSGNAVEWTEERVRAADKVLDALPMIIAYLSGSAMHPGGDVLNLLLDSSVLPRLVGFAPVNLLRLASRPGLGLRSPFLGVALPGAAELADARAIAELFERAGCTPTEAHDAVVRAAIVDSWETPALRPDQLTWFMRENPRLFENILGITAGHTPLSHDDNRSEVLAILAASETLPAKYVAHITSLAIGSGKTHRVAAQTVLANHGLAEALAEDTLLSPSADQRAIAVAWVRDIGGPWAVAALSRYLNSEQQPNLRARVIAALEWLGEDITAHLRSDVLEAEAEAGLLKKPPTSVSWIPLDEIPVCVYRDGSQVPAQVLRWWVILAVSLRDPLGAGLLPRYLRMLDSASAHSLSRWALMTWIARDTTPLDDATVMVNAMRAVARYERRMEGFSLRYPELFFEWLDEERASIAEATPSAIADKGMLALAGMLPGGELAETVRQYMRRNHLKRAQIEALMGVLSTADDAEAVQLLVATARRYRTASVQQAAAALVEQVAKRRGWSADELADRMIPTAGLDDDGMLRLDYGPRVFVGRLTDDLTLRLETSDGELIKALPAPRSSDTSAAAAKAQLAASRKELKSIVTVQRRRLYDAMCVRREWRVAAWREFLIEHPVMGLLTGALVWQVGAVAVRPDPDGTLRDASKRPVNVSDDAVITIAHSTSLPAEEIARWSSSTVNAFNQFRAVPVEATDATRRADREGWLGETFQLRALARLLEWDRGPTADDVRFDEYVKTFSSARLQAAISFSGSQLPETSQPIAFGVLTVRRLDAGGRATADLTFAEVPDALRAELVADYLALGE